MTDQAGAGLDATGGGRWFAAVALALAIACVILAVLAARIIIVEDKAVDFLSYWAAAKLALTGNAAGAYDVATHRAVEATVAQVGGLLAFPYPPPFLLLVMPFGAGGFGAGFVAWVALTGIAFVLAARAITATRYALAQPAAFANAISGQNGFLTTAIFVGGLKQLEKRPFLAGTILSLLVIKPQIALLLPVALIAARQWRAIGGAIAGAAGVLLLTLTILGPAAFRGFVEILPVYTQAMDREAWPWNEFASTFALVRHLGAERGLSLVIHGVVAIAAAWLTWRAWRTNHEARIPILAACTLLLPPYLLTYDSLLLLVPFAWLVQQGRYPAAATLWLLSLLPILTYFKVYPGPTTIPLGAAFAIACLWRGGRGGAHSMSAFKSVGR